MNKLLIGLLVVVCAGFAFYYGTQNGWFTRTAAPTETQEPTRVTPTVSVTATPTSMPTTSIPKGWSTFTSDKYGFSISFPPRYKALTDKENMYGWPKAVVLIYGGGQSYDLVIEHWSSMAEYEKVYKNETRTSVRKIGVNYISFFNMNSVAEVDEIIETLLENLK